MSTTIPSRDISIEDKKLYRERTIEVALHRAVNKGLASSKDGLIFRDLAPEDLGLTAWATPSIPSGGSYITWINHENTART